MKSKFLSFCYAGMVAVCVWGGPSVALAVTSPEAVVTVLGSPGTAEIFSITTPSPPITPVTVNNYPTDLAITPDGREAWVCNDYVGIVSVIDLASKTVVANVSILGRATPHIAITPDGTEAWVVNPHEKLVSVINIASRTLVNSSIPIGSVGAYLAFTPDGKQAWVCNVGDNNLSIIDTASRTPIGLVPVGVNPLDIAMTPDGKQAWVTNAGGTTVSVIDTSFSHPTVNIFVGIAPNRIAMTPDGTQAWVTAGGLPTNQIAVIDVATQTVLNYVPGSISQSIAFSPDGKQAWSITPVPGTVHEYNRLSQTLVQTLTFSNPTQDLAITPDQAPTARFAVTTNGVVASFDASASSSPYGSIATYAWNFGDGSPVQNVAIPQISYSYAQVGTYTVTLTVTNTQGTSTTQTFTGTTVSNNGGPSAQTSQQITVDFAPPQFTGNPKIHKDQKKLFLKTTWSASPSSTVSRYQITGKKKTRAIIPATRKRKYLLRLHPQHIQHKHLSKKYRRYLEKKYSIRALTANGVPSTATPLRIVPK